MEESIKKRKRLDEMKVALIIKQWKQKSIEDFAQEFEVTANTIRAMVYEIRKVDPNLCPKKPKKKRADMIRDALRLLEGQDRILKL